MTPSQELGALRSAESNRTSSGFLPMDSSFRSLVAQVGLLAMALAWMATATVAGRSPEAMLPWSSVLTWSQKGVALAAALGAGLIGVGVTRALRRRRATFVGALGLQVRTETLWGGGRSEVVRFADCRELQVEQTRQLLNGAYTRTTFRYSLVDRSGRPLFVIAGSFDERAPGRPSDQRRFALAAEQTWMAWKRAQAGPGAA